MKQLGIVFLAGALVACNGTSNSNSSPDGRLSEESLKTFRYKRSSGCVNSKREKGLNPKYFGECGDLREIKHLEANLQGANLRGANLAQVYLDGTDLSLADLRGADLTGVDLARAKNVRGAKYSSETKISTAQRDLDLLGLIKIDDSILDKDLLATSSVGKVDLQRIQTLLSLGADPWVNFNNVSALTVAVKQKQFGLLKLFIEDGHDLSRANETTPLVAAAVDSGDPMMVELLLKNGANANAANGAAIAKAVDQRKIEILKMLLANGGKFPVMACTEDWGCLSSAFKSGSIDIFKVLIAGGADPNGRAGFRVLTRLLTASNGLESPYLDAMLAAPVPLKFEVDDTCVTQLQRVRSGALARKFLKAKAPTEPTGRCGEFAFNALAAELQKEDGRGTSISDSSLQDLFKAFGEANQIPKFDRASSNPTAFALAPKFRYFKAAAEAGMDWKVKDRNGQALYHFVASQLTGDYFQVFTWMLDRGISLDEANSAGDSLGYLALKSSIRRSDFANVFSAIQSRTFNAKGKDSKTGRGLVHALLVEAGGLLPKGLAAWLVSHGADPNFLSPTETTALAACADLNCLNDLVAAGADIKLKNKMNESILQMRIRERLPVSKSLLAEYRGRGIDLSEKDSGGRTALDSAILNGAAADLIQELAATNPTHPFFTTRFIRCEDTVNVYAMQLAFSNLSRNEFVGEALRFAAKTNLADVKAMDPMSSVVQIGSGILNIDMTDRNNRHFVVSTENFSNWYVTYTGLNFSCTVEPADPLPTVQFMDLLVDCRSAAGPFKWLRINDEGPTSGGVAERNRDRKELATVATTQPEFNGYVMDQGRNPLYLYIKKDALKTLSSPVQVYYATSKPSKIENVASLQCALKRP